MDEPVELLNASYQQIGSEFVVVFTVNGIEQEPFTVPKCDIVDLVSCFCKAINVVADPIGECVNDIPM